MDRSVVLGEMVVAAVATKIAHRYGALAIATGLLEIAAGVCDPSIASLGRGRHYQLGRQVDPAKQGEEENVAVVEEAEAEVKEVVCAEANDVLFRESSQKLGHCAPLQIEKDEDHSVMLL